jgi:hypothetical protein
MSIFLVVCSILLTSPLYYLTKWSDVWTNNDLPNSTFDLLMSSNPLGFWIGCVIMLSVMILIVSIPIIIAFPFYVIHPVFGSIVGFILMWIFIAPIFVLIIVGGVLFIPIICPMMMICITWFSK